MSWKEIEAQAGAKGTIIFMETAAGRVSKLVYVTENGRYTVTYENGEYSVEEN